MKYAHIVYNTAIRQWQGEKKKERKKTVLWAQQTHIFHFRFFLFFSFFFFFLPKSCKISLFLTKIWKILAKIFEKKSKYFLQKFLQKSIWFGEKKKKKIKESHDRLTDPTWWVCPPIKQGWFFVIYGHRSNCKISNFELYTK